MTTVQARKGDVSTDNTPPQTPLSHIWLEITGKCNLTCGHCYAESSPSRPLRQSMGDNDWYRIIDEARREGAKSIQFIGGEPTLHPRLGEFLERSRTAGYETIEVFTNASLLNDRHIQALLGAGASIAVSFYSDREETHEKITGVKGSFDRTISGIKKALAAGIRVRAAIVKFEQTEEETAGAEQLLRAIGVSSISLDRARNVGRLDAGGQDGENFGELCGSCSNARLCVTSSGETHPCIMSRKVVLGDAKIDSVRNLFQSRRLAEFASAQKEFAAKMDSSSCHPSTVPCLPLGPCPPNRVDLAGPCLPNSGNCNPASTCGPNAP